MSDKILIHTSHMKLRWGDMDAFGHVNNTIYFRYMEQTRIEWLERAGSSMVIDGHGPCRSTRDPLRRGKRQGGLGQFQGRKIGAITGRGQENADCLVSFAKESRNRINNTKKTRTAHSGQASR